jgi:CubicO group peptidase (beta-lactamase class C family)
MVIQNAQFCLLGAALTLLTSACNASSETTAVDTIPPEIVQAEALISPWQTEDAPGLSIAISVNDEIVFARGAGLANLEHGIAITPDTAFQVASISKQFTAFSTLMLVSDGHIDLDADIRTYLPELSAHPRTVTVRHLLDHMGGLRELTSLSVMAGWMADDIRQRDRELELLSRQSGVNFPAGAEVEYSNTGYTLLSHIVARVSGQSFHDFTRERIFEPLGMTGTRFPESRNALIASRAASYYPTRDGFANVVAANETAGSTGLFTTAPDLLKWAENFETRTVGDDRVFELMAERASAENGDASVFAKGQELRVYNGLETWSHGGTDAGYRAFLLRIPSEDFELSVMSNRTDFDSAGLAFALADIFLGDSANFTAEPDLDWSPAISAQLAAYAGDYEIQPGMIFTITAGEDALLFGSLGANADDLQPLPQIAERAFMLNPGSDISLVFAEPEDGASPYFDYTIGLHGSLKAPRVELAPFDAGSVTLAEFAGVYESEELATAYTVTASDDGLMITHPRTGSFQAAAYQDDTFSSFSGAMRKLAFIRNQQGEITGFYGSAPLVDRVAFTRRDR